MKEDKLKKNLNSSGFPFQLAVENVIRSISGWKVGRREYPWRNNDTGENGFIDIIAEKDSGSTLIVECKRVRDAEWIFLCSPRNIDRSHARFWVNQGGQAPAAGWYDGSVEPTSPEADFCAVMGQDHRKPLLENLASELISATEAFAGEEFPFFKEMPTSMAYFPVIITTAELYICEINLSDLEIESGEIKDPIFKQVPCVRFRKSLTTAPPIFFLKKKIRFSEELAEARQRTLFILNASYVGQTLGNWEIRYR